MHEKNVKEKTFEVRDYREHDFFIIDNTYITGKWLRLLKGCPTAVYFAICRHADKSQQAFPGIEYLSEETGYSERQVMRAIQSLEGHKLIHVDREKREHNIYVLLNKRHWRKSVAVRKESVVDKGDPYMKGTTDIPINDLGNPMMEN